METTIVYRSPCAGEHHLVEEARVCSLHGALVLLELLQPLGDLVQGDRLSGHHLDDGEDLLGGVVSADGITSPGKLKP